MIGTAAIPITALSAKLISMNRNNRATTSQAPFGVPLWWVLVTPLYRTAVSRILALVDREAWTLIGNSVQGSGYPSVPLLRYGWVPRQDDFCYEKVRHPRSVLRRKSCARAHPGRRVQSIHTRRLCRHQHARNREARQGLEKRSLCEFQQDRKSTRLNSSHSQISY